MIDGTEKPKIPSKFAKRAARYNEFRCNLYFDGNLFLYQFQILLIFGSLAV